MDMNKVIAGLDQLFTEARMDEVIPYLTSAEKNAQAEGDYGSVLSILNELIGFCRETCQYEESMAYAKDAVMLIQQMNLTGTIHHATTLLNIANALRAAGHLEDSLTTYQQVEQMYEQLLPENDFGFANLNNNLSLLYQEKGDFYSAVQCLQKALHIVEQYPEKEWELAVTYTNLANTYLKLDTSKDEPEDIRRQAVDYGKRAVALFEKMQIKDTHYAAAMAAMGQIYEEQKEYTAAVQCYRQGMEAIRATLGETDYYNRMKEYLNRVMAKAGVSEQGLELSHSYYEDYGLPMLNEKYSNYMEDITVGLVGEGSDCFGFDDQYSRDHDWGTGFCIWLSDSAYEEIGEQLQEDYDHLPEEYKGYHRITSRQGQNRVGVHRVRDFYEHFIGKQAYEEWQEIGLISNDTMLAVPEYRLAAAVNGEVWKESMGEFTRLRSYLKNYYNDTEILLKLAQACALFSQNAQYNYVRMKRRGDKVAASFALNDGIKQALNIGYVLNHMYTPHDKWLWEGTKRFTVVPELTTKVKHIIELQKEDSDIAVEQSVEELAGYLLEAMLSENYIGNVRFVQIGSGEQNVADTYLEHYSEELALRSGYIADSPSELVDDIVKMEWKAFDKVINEGGRAGCQDDWETFSIMRASQYLTWTKEMLLQYAVDFRLALIRGWNPIMEKYGRMEQSTAPEKWNAMKEQFPVIPPEKQAIMEEIIKIQVQWMEAFAEEYPGMAQNARRIHTSEDQPWDTSYETYLRGEMGTYSDQMLDLYGRFIVKLYKDGRNLAYEIMEQTVHLYGYESLADAAERMEHGK